MNRCPHVCSCPSDRECPHDVCGCPLDFDCPHGGVCETEDECDGRDEVRGLELEGI